MAATLLGLSGLSASAVTDDEVSALLAETLFAPEWNAVCTATAGGGYKDNVFLSPTDPRGAAFASASAELLVLRFSPLGPRFNFFANADARHFFGNGLSHQEYTSFNQAMYERDFNEHFQGSLIAQYLYQDQLLDVSVSQTNREAVPVLGHTFSARPGGKMDLPGGNWLALETHATRQLLQRPLDDYWDAGFRLSVGHGYGWDSKVTLSYEPFWRPYDNDPARTATGTTITNSHRRSFQQEGRLEWRHNWNEPKTWRTVLGLSGRVNRENGGGYFDYVRWSASGKIQYVAHGWELSAQGRFARYDYDTQIVDATDPTKRIRTEWSVGLDLERKLAEKIVWVTSYEFEETLSNDPLETYTLNMVSTALRWEF